MNSISNLSAALVKYVSPTGEPLLSPVQVAARQSVTTGYLAACRCNPKHSLKFVKIGKHVFYLEADVDAYFAARQSKVAK